MWFLAVLHIYKTFLRSIQWCILSFKHFEMSHIVHFISINHLQNLSYVHISPDLICFSLLLQRKVRPSRWSKHAYGRVWSAPSRSLSSSVSCLSQPIRCFAVVWSNRMDQSQRRSNSTYNSDTNGKKKKKHAHTNWSSWKVNFIYVKSKCCDWNIFEMSYSFSGENYSYLTANVMHSDI